MTEQAVLADGVEPLREPFALAPGEHLGEGPDVTGPVVLPLAAKEVFRLRGRRGS
jgi:hypothetical protein